MAKTFDSLSTSIILLDIANFLQIWSKFAGYEAELAEGNQKQKIVLNEWAETKINTLSPKLLNCRPLFLAKTFDSLSTSIILLDIANFLQIWSKFAGYEAELAEGNQKQKIVLNE